MIRSIPFVLMLVGTPQPPASPAEPLSFRELFEPSPRALVPSARLTSLDGKRVHIVGYMAEMETPPRGGFYLCAFPVVATEAGAGTADLPPDAVFVVVPSAAGRALQPIHAPLDVVGVLELGSQTDEDGRVSSLRIVLDGPEHP